MYGRDGTSASADSDSAWLEEFAADISPDELLEFLAADLFPSEADPAFRRFGDVEGPKVLWRFLGNDDSGRVMRVTIDRPAPPDVNTPGDYEALLADEQ